MATDPDLHDDIGKLAGEIHELSEKFSAKEVLAQKAAELAKEAAELAAANAKAVEEAANATEETAKVNRNYRRLVLLILVLLLVVIGTVVWLYVLAGANRELVNCQARFNKANELRSTLLTEYSEEQQDAMKGLVEARGLPNDDTIIRARDSWLEANWMLAEARRLNPVPKYEDYCKNVPGVDPPKVPPAKTPDQRLYPGPQLPAQ